MITKERALLEAHEINNDFPEWSKEKVAANARKILILRKGWYTPEEAQILVDKSLAGKELSLAPSNIQPKITRWIWN